MSTPQNFRKPSVLMIWPLEGSMKRVSRKYGRCPAPGVSGALISIGRDQYMPAAPATMMGWPQRVKAVPQAFCGIPVG